MGISLGNRLLGSTGLSAGLGLSRGNRLYFAGFGSTFTPASLFAAGEPGAWYDPSDFSTLFQDAAGTTPVTAVEQYVGLMLDKSKGLVLGSEIVVNGNFATNSTSGWTEAITGGTLNASTGQLVVNNTAGIGNTGVYQVKACAAGQYLKVSVNVVARTEARIAVFNGTLGAIVYNNNALPVGTTTFYTGPMPSGTFTVYAHCSAGNTATFDDISVRELPGNHASQSTSAARPQLRALYNLLVQTEDFSSASWLKDLSASVIANDGLAPDGTNTADRFVAPVGTTTYAIYQIFSSPDNTDVRFRLLVNRSTLSSDWFYIRIRSKSNVNSIAWFNIASGTAGTTSGSPISTSITSVGGGYYALSLTANSATGATSQLVVLAPCNADGNQNWTGSTTSGPLIWGADLRVANDGVNLPPYQRVAAAGVYDTTGFPPYLAFDGSDDSMSTATITPGIDRAQVFAGVRKLSDAVYGSLAETSVDFTLNNGSFGLFAPGGTSPVGAAYGFGARGTATSNPTAPSTLPAPTTSVLAGLVDIAGSSVAARVNGLSYFSSSGAMGTGNFLAYPLYIGRRGGTTFAFNGRLYSLILRFGANLTDTQIAQTESYVSTKMGGGYVPVGYDYLVDANGDQLTDASGNALYTIPLYS